MTCVAALKRDNVIYMCADSAASGNNVYSIRVDQKVHVAERFIMGYSTSYRGGQLIKHVFSIPDHPPDVDDMQYMVKYFAEGVRTTLKDGGMVKVDDNVESVDFEMILGYNGTLYTFEQDMQIAQDASEFLAIGSGSDFALGAMSYMRKYTDWFGTKPKVILQRAVEAAVAHDTTVRPPYVHVSKRFT